MSHVPPRWGWTAAAGIAVVSVVSYAGPAVQSKPADESTKFTG